MGEKQHLKNNVVEVRVNVSTFRERARTPTLYTSIDMVGCCLVHSELWEDKVKLSNFSKDLVRLCLQTIRVYEYSQD
jgi:hypothetical protein